MSGTSILRLAIRSESDVVGARRRARQIAAELGFDTLDQSRLATAVSELAREVTRLADGGLAEFLLEEAPRPKLVIRMRGRREGASLTPPPTLGRLVDRLSTAPETPGELCLEKALPPRAAAPDRSRLTRLAASLAMEEARDGIDEVRRQDQEILQAFQELEARQEELGRLNKELEETNRGVLALYAELDARAEDLKRVSETKSAFLSNMTHEFRTPLNSILSLSRMLLERTDGDLTAEQERQVRFILRGAGALSDLVNDLLDLAKVEAGKVEVRPESFEVADLFSALRGMMRPLLPANSSVVLIFEEPKGPPRLVTDEAKLAQILRNFISNALKYTEQGEVRVSCRAEGNGRISFEVADTGIGIAPENLGRIFEEFTQVENPAQGRIKGTGLGLPLSRKLAGLLGGEVGLRSVFGRGSKFWVTIPIRLAGTPEPEESQLDPSTISEETVVEVTRRSVLIVDDDESSRYLLRQLLKESSFDVFEAVGGREGIRRATELSPSVILLDLVMPDCDGHAVLDALANDPATRGIPVVVNTSKLLSEDERAALEAKGASVVSKSEWTIPSAADRLRGALDGATGRG